MKVTELIFFKDFRHRIRLTAAAEKQGCKIENCHDEGYVIISIEVPE